MSEPSVMMNPSQESYAVTSSTPPALPGNVGLLERWASLVGGGALVLYGLRRSLGSLGVACGGGVLVYRALTGHCPIYQAMGIDTTNHSTSPASPRKGTGV